MGLAARPGRGVPAVHDAHGTRRTAGFGDGAPDRNRLGPASPAATSRPAWLLAERIVSEALRVRGDLVKAMAAHQGRGATVLLEADQWRRRPSGPEHAACRGVLRSGMNRRADSSGY